MGKGGNVMVRRISFWIVFAVLLANFGVIGQAFASETLGSLEWQLSHVVDMQNHSIQLSQPILHLDADYGFAYLSFYGALCSEDGIDCTPVNGSGYFYDDTSATVIKMGIRAGTKEYRITVSPETLGGTFAIYNKDGQIEYVGSIDLQQLY